MNVSGSFRKYVSQIHFWDDMKDAKKVFEKYKVHVKWPSDLFLKPVTFSPVQIEERITAFTDSFSELAS